MLRLEQPSRLFGRDEELRLLDSFVVSDTIKPDAPIRTCLVRGHAGCGKTVLCHNIGASPLFRSVYQRGAIEHQHQTGCRGHFIFGKFHQKFHSQRDESTNKSLLTGGPLAQAFTNFAQQLVYNDLVGLDISQHEARILGEAIPGFLDLFLHERVDSDISFEKIEPKLGMIDNKLNLSDERLTVALRTLLREFCSPGRPVVLFLDDFQWCDEETCSVLSNILSDRSISNFVLLGAIRNGETGTANDSKISDLVEELFGAKRDKLSDTQSETHLNIHLDTLSLGFVNEIVCNMMASRNKEEALSLATVVHSKTGGNPFSVVQFCESLFSKDLLRYNFSRLKWEWDLSRIAIETDVTENVVDVVRNRIHHLGSDVVETLIVASYVGFQFEADLLRALIREGVLYSRSNLIPERPLKSRTETNTYSRQSTEDPLELALREGLVENISNSRQPAWKFSHDRIQQTMYELVPPGLARDDLHYRIGWHIYKSYCLESRSPSYSKWLLVAAEQINLGMEALKQSSLFVIRLNYDAAVVAKHNSGIRRVGDLLSTATSLTEARHWDDHYHLLLEIHSWSAEVEFSRGNVDQCRKMISIIMSCIISHLSSNLESFSLNHPILFGSSFLCFH